MMMEKTLTQLAEEAKTIKSKEDRNNFICRNIFDLLDIITASKEDLREMARLTIEINKLEDEIDNDIEKLKRGNTDAG